MILTFDTSILIDIERGKKETLNQLRLITKKHAGSAYILYTPYMELYSGLLKKKIKNFNQGYLLLQKFVFLAPTKDTAEITAKLKREYSQKGVTISEPDLFIAAQVVEHNLLLVTRDKDFSRIKEIKSIILN